MKETTTQISNIDVSLSQGNLLDRKQKAVLYVGIVSSLLCPLLTVVLLIVTGVEWDSFVTFVMAGSDILSISFLAVLFFILMKNNKIRQKINLWLDDAIETRAYSKKIGENRLGMQPKAVKIRVRFKIAGKIYTRDSTGKVFGGWKGYLGVYKKYADKEIRILYSPKHDEVLILKQKNYNKTPMECTNRIAAGHCEEDA